MSSVINTEHWPTEAERSQSALAPPLQTTPSPILTPVTHSTPVTLNNAEKMNLKK